MSVAAFKRLGFAAWFVAIALIANLAAQNQLSINVVEATTERAAEAPKSPDTPVDPHAHHKQMAEGHEHHAEHQHHAVAAQAPATPTSHDHSAGHHGPGGHTHKGHADCAVCGVVAVMAALTLPAALIIEVPRDVSRPPHAAKADTIRTAARYAPYSSRAPPLFT